MSFLRKKEKKEVKSKQIIIQENPDECIRLIENSFLKGVFSDSLTDIYYNGVDIYAQDNDIGRYKLQIMISSDEVLELVKKIANYMLKPFSFINNTLDVSFGDYRLNAVHPTLARSNNQKVITFSLRRITATLKIKPYDVNLAPKEVHDLLKCVIRSYQSILISGQTGAGKTELQKFLISFMNKQDRLIIIEESYETHIKEIYKEMDVTSWLVDNKKDELSSLVRLALRNNPDWIIVAETRGVEAYDMVQATMTGHSAITTIHSESCEYSLKRITQMCKKSIDFDEQMLLNTMAKHIKIGIHVEKVYDETNFRFRRRISKICEYIPENDGYSANNLFYISKDENLIETCHYGHISTHLKEQFIKHNISLTNIKMFIKKEVLDEKEKV